jgi:RNA polymerase sigma-70 factor (ECF subfamily)
VTTPTTRPQPPSDDERVLALCAVDRRALIRCCAAITGEPAAAEDLAQEAWLEAWRLRERLLDPSGAQPWVAAIARNVSLRWRRSRARERAGLEGRGTDAVADPAPADDPTATLLRTEVVQLLREALALLPEPTRAALVAHHLDGVPQAVVASRLGVSNEVLSMRLHRGRQALRALLEGQHAEYLLDGGFVTPAEIGWRPTRIWCVDCGDATLQVRRDPTTQVIEFRCAACEPDAVSSRFELDDAVYGPVLRAVSRPSAVLDRGSQWFGRYIRHGITAGAARCTACGSAADVAPYERADEPRWATRHGWAVDCSRCGHELTSSLAGLTLSDPAVTAFRRHHPRSRLVEQDDGVLSLRADARPGAAPAEIAVRIDLTSHQPLPVVVGASPRS